MQDYLREAASRDPVGRLLTTLLRTGSEGRISACAKEVDLSERDFLSAVAEAEWGGLLKREERTDGIYLRLTPPGQARAEVIARPLLP